MDLMQLQQRHIALRGGHTVSAIVAYPDGFEAGSASAVIFAHGAGNDMNTPFLSAMQEGLAARGYVVVKFNFPYKERGGRAPDPPAVLQDCYLRVLEEIRSDGRIAAPRVVIGGKSLGGRMASHVAAQGAEVAGLIFLGYPLHPPGKTDRLRTAHLPAITAPMLFFAGTRDSLCRLDLLQETVKGLRAPTQLHIIEGGDHSFVVPKRLKREAASVWSEMVKVSADWLDRLN